MDIKTAFYWDVKSNSINYLICRIGKNHLEILFGPEKFVIKSRKSGEFVSEAEEIIKIYFQKLRDFITKLNSKKLIIEHRILHSGAPAHVFSRWHPGYNSKHLSEDRSGIILDLFKAYREKLEKLHYVINKKQTQSILKKDEFKLILKNLGIINEVNTGKYKWYLWSIFLHLSSKLSLKDHEKIRINLWRPIFDTVNSRIGSEMRYKEWLENVLP